MSFEGFQKNDHTSRKYEKNRLACFYTYEIPQILLNQIDI